MLLLRTSVKPEPIRKMEWKDKGFIIHIVPVQQRVTEALCLLLGINNSWIPRH